MSLGQWQNRARNFGSTDLPSRTIRLFVNPPAKALDATATGLSNFCIGILQGSRLAQENQKLKELAGAAELYNERLAELESENNSLRKLQNLPQFGHKERIPARVTGVFANEFRIGISAGIANGVGPGMPVIAADGLLGIVQNCESQSSQVTLIWSPPPFKIGAIVDRQPMVAGLLHGEAWNRLMLEVGLDAPVQPGDLVITSGFSERIPRGIPIGRVTQVQQDREFGVEKVSVLPQVQLGDVQEVLVLK